MRIGISLLPLSLGGLALLLPSIARADEGVDVCKDAYESAQSLMRPSEGRLVEARTRLRACSQTECKSWMVADCTKWLTEVEGRIPTVVFSAKDAGGRDLVDVTVKSGETTVATRLDGRALEVDPGQRTFVFALADGTTREVSSLVAEGGKAQRIAVSFPGGAAPPVAITTAEGAGPTTAPATSERDTADAGATWRTAGYVVGATGLVAIGVGVVFGVKAAGSKSDAKCDATNACDASALSDARSSATVSTIGLVAGGALLAGGVAFVLLAPSSKGSRSARLEASPHAGQGSAGLLLRGTW